MAKATDLDTPLVQISDSDSYTVRDFCTHWLCLGGTGSGKTSGPGKTLAASLLRAGMGGCVLIAKAEDAQLWGGYLAENGRADSLVEFSPTQHCYNFIAYELTRLGSDGIGSVVECLMRVLEAARNASPSPGRTGDAFWESTTRQILRNTLPILYAAQGTVTMADIVNFIRTAPRSPEEMRDPEWQKRSFFCAMFLGAAGRIPDEIGLQATAYWRDEFSVLDPKTRGNVALTLTTTLDRFNHGWLKRAFCGRTDIVPELSFHGAIFILNMPALTLGDDAIVAQVVFKFMWQRAVLARNALSPEQRERFLFLWSDEAQTFVNSYDAEFLATCRSSRCGVAFLSQSLPTFYAKVGGENARERVHHLLGNFGTKVFASNGCPETNEWAARTIGRRMVQRGNYSRGEGANQSWGYSDGMNVNDGVNGNWGVSSSSGMSGNQRSSSSGSSVGGGWSSGTGENRGANEGHGFNSSTSHGYSEQMDHTIEPGEFARLLKNGGPANRGIVSTVWFQAGRTFASSGANVMFARFQQ